MEARGESASDTWLKPKKTQRSIRLKTVTRRDEERVLVSRAGSMSSHRPELSACILSSHAF